MAHPMATPHESSAREPQLRSVSSIHWQSVGRYAAATDAPLPLERHGLERTIMGTGEKKQLTCYPQQLESFCILPYKALMP